MLSFGATEGDLSTVRVDDIDLARCTVRLGPIPGSDGPRVLKFVTTCAGRSSREVFERYLSHRSTIVKWVRLNNRGATEPEELLVYDRGAEVMPFKAGSTSITNRLRRISKATGVPLTEGRLLSTYFRNLAYADCNERGSPPATAGLPPSEGATEVEP
ncbi:MAG: hypothetical protein IKG94_07455 [Candidatus Methanomethylophilaceae archaeon]|nr:hypothetical protein [Candidatus Methanomethylophilaceae archaeon]MBR6205217.1 hypothetical protein [Candidatus Methanomethylophilaceae archaeon]